MGDNEMPKHHHRAFDNSACIYIAHFGKFMKFQVRALEQYSGASLNVQASLHSTEKDFVHVCECTR